MKQKIAVLGGGISSLVAVFEMTSVPGWKERYDITVYQLGWRLGGKCASGRNREIADRIEEHGLHLFFGFYENAIGIMRRCYQELGRHPEAPLATWQDAFKPRDFIVMEEWEKGRWHPWPLVFPRTEGTPGEWAEPFPDGGHSGAIDRSELPTAWQLARRVIRVAVELFEDYWFGRTQEQVAEAVAQVHPTIEAIATGGGGVRTEGELLGTLTRAFSAYRDLGETLSAPLRDMEMLGLHLTRALMDRMPEDPAAHSRFAHRGILWLLARFRRWLAEELQPEIDSSFATHKIFVSLDLACTVVIGMLTDDLVLPPVDWHKINGEDLREWLRRHGGSEELLRSAVIRTVYSACFATDATGAAGTGLYGCLLIAFGYRGSVIWEMQAGMGDTIFGPLYEVLERRGVRFEFFRRVDRLELGEKDRTGQRRVERIVVGVQATTKNGRPYRPLFDVKGLPCWPSTPLYEQLDQGDRLKQLDADHPNEYSLENWWTRWQDPEPPVVLQAGRDFDLCLLGISIGAFPYICEELIEDAGNPRFGNMVRMLETTLTQAAQLWIRPDLEQMGWPFDRPVVIPYAEPYDTWSDMTHLVPRERWEHTGHPVGNIAYLCGRLIEGPDFEPPPRTDHLYPFGQLERAEHNLGSWLDSHAAYLWPHAVRMNRPECFNYDWLVDLEGRRGKERLKAQWCIADWNPSDRYVLSLKGGTDYRLLPYESGYQNLFLTGDWTLSSISAGSVEGATLAGMRAARALCGYPQTMVGNWLDAVLPPSRRPPPPAVALPPRPGRLEPSPVDGVPYIPRPGDLMTLPPIVLYGGTLCCFAVSAERAAIQSLCDTYLNLGPVTYEPLLPVAVFVAADVRKAHARDRSQDLGWMPERDYAFWVPLRAGRRINGRFEVERFVWFQPFMWIDNPAAVKDGREVFGLEKCAATLSGPRQSTDPARFGVETIVSDLKRGTEARTAPLVRVHAVDRSQFGEPSNEWTSSDDVVAGLARELEKSAREDGWAEDLALLGELLTGDQLLAALKQFPCLTDAHTACYQAIVETPSRAISPIRGGLIDGTYRLAIKPYASHRVAENLGLTTRDTQDGWQECEVLVGTYFRFDFELGHGRVIYRIR